VRNIGLGLLQLKTTAVGSALLILGAVCLSGCATSSSSKGAWQGSASARQPVKKVLIVGISADFTQRCAFEWSMASQINTGSTLAFTSCDSMTSKDPLTRANIEKVVASDQVDAVLTTAVVSMQLGGQKGNTRDTRATPYYQVTGEGFVTGDLGYYGVPVAFVQLDTTPSITLLTGDIHVVTKIFQSNDATLTYTLDTQAKSGNIQSSSTGIDTITALIADRLRRDGVIQ
jgi:hypothetical protein